MTNTPTSAASKREVPRPSAKLTYQRVDVAAASSYVPRSPN